MPHIHFENVWKLFGESSAAVADLNLDIHEGEFLVLVGPSGCGKTTTLRMLAGLERPSHGRILMGDRDVTDVPPGQRDVSMVFQSYALYPNMNVYKNLAFGPKVRKEPKADLDRRIQEVADLLGIAHLLRRSPSALSGGQRQRVALGRALIREPQLFLLDEPLSNLDAALRVQMRAELIRIHNRLNQTTTAYVTHDQVEALTMGDRVAVLRDGALLQVDTPVELYENPRNQFVAEFIGSPKMNFLPASMESAGSDVVVELLEQRFVLPVTIRSRLEAVPVRAVVGLRPHDLVPAAGTAVVRLRGEVDVSEHTGTEVFVTTTYGDLKLVARFPRWPVPESGEKVELTFDPEHLYLFDPSTGESILSRSHGGALAQKATLVARVDESQSPPVSSAAK